VRETTITIKGIPYKITDEDVRQAARNSSPEKIRDYYIEVEGECFPPKQLIRLVTKTLDSFGSMNARSALQRIGFPVPPAKNR